ncbi:hypothetical protein LTSESEN_1772 [Salmonella enterica subsp. enterica serovar Senftenberg str. A4-543]|uniref:Uncharacterized protein n=2 Tax=Enterobacteriaceae TaxID=543 RepID=G5QY77_SALSE|nr:hypothetical protein LTSESEN_1772 [Salmonella enterica subsp. enterica serovar Senftenberg str. A4-543]
MQEYFPAGGRDYDHICELFDAIAAGKIPGVKVGSTEPGFEQAADSPRMEDKEISRAAMVHYIQAAIGEGYQPEYADAVSDLSILWKLREPDLSREYGKCWQWYDMGGGFHETFSRSKNDGFEKAVEPLIKWLAENVHPHHHVIVTSTGAELLMSERVHNTDKYLKD